MIIPVSREKILRLLVAEIKAWESVGGGPNLAAFDFDPKTVDRQQLEDLGYYTNRESWIAGVRIKALNSYIKELEVREVLKPR